MYTCFSCGAAWESSLRQPAIKETCERCGAYLHCCRNCTYHRRSYPNECYIPDTEKIADRRRANFCDEFEFAAAVTRKKHATLEGADRTTLLSDETPSTSPTLEVKEWLGTSDKVPKDFEDLFED